MQSTQFSWEQATQLSYGSSLVMGHVPTHPSPEASPDPHPTLTQTWCSPPSSLESKLHSCHMDQAWLWAMSLPTPPLKLALTLTQTWSSPPSSLESKLHSCPRFLTCLVKLPPRFIMPELALFVCWKLKWWMANDQPDAHVVLDHWHYLLDFSQCHCSVLDKHIQDTCLVPWGPQPCGWCQPSDSICMAF